MEAISRIATDLLKSRELVKKQQDSLSKKDKDIEFLKVHITIGKSMYFFAS
jgi:hypothetical protein